MSLKPIFTAAGSSDLNRVVSGQGGDYLIRRLGTAAYPMCLFDSQQSVPNPAGIDCSVNRTSKDSRKSR
jgi:hypothetical protein